VNCSWSAPGLAYPAKRAFVGCALAMSQHYLQVVHDILTLDVGVRRCVSCRCLHPPGLRAVPRSHWAATLCLLPCWAEQTDRALQRTSGASMHLPIRLSKVASETCSCVFGHVVVSALRVSRLSRAGRCSVPRVQFPFRWAPAAVGQIKVCQCFDCIAPPATDPHIVAQ